MLHAGALHSLLQEGQSEVVMLLLILVLEVPDAGDHHGLFHERQSEVVLEVPCDTSPLWRWHSHRGGGGSDAGDGRQGIGKTSKWDTSLQMFWRPHRQHHINAALSS